MDQLPNNKLLDFSGKTVIVTGGSMGIGLGIVKRFAQAGANVVIADRNPVDDQKVVDEMATQGLKITPIKTDVSVEADVKNLVSETVRAFNHIDVLVNNAGIYPNIPVTKMTLEDFEKILAVNLKGVFLTTKFVSEWMIAQSKGGNIINITSIDALHPSMVGLAAYDASKHGVWGFTKNVALELAPHKIWVNAIAPGGIATPGVAKMQQPAQPGADAAKAIEAFMSAIPMHRMGDPDDIGKVALFLASDMASYMTGSQVVVDGGFLLT